MKIKLFALLFILGLFTIACSLKKKEVDHSVKPTIEACK